MPFLQINHLQSLIELYLFQLCMIGSPQLRKKFHEKIMDAVEDHLELDTFDFDDTEVPFDILRDFGTFLMKCAYDATTKDGEKSSDELEEE